MDVKTENTIKRLEQDKSKATDPKMKEIIQAKINTLKGNKDVLK